MAKRWGILLVAMCLCVSVARAQVQEAPEIQPNGASFSRGALMSVSAELDKKLARGFHVSAETEVRMKEMTNYAPNVNHLKLIEVGPKVSYKICDYLKVGAGYAYRAYLKDGKKSTAWKNYWEHRHVIVMEAVASYKVTNWKFSLRMRPELTIRMGSINPLEKVRNFWELRTRLQAEYDFGHVPVEIYAYTEMFNTLNALNPNESLAAVYKTCGMTNPYAEDWIVWSGQYVNNVRAVLGVGYRFDKRNSIKVYYRFDYDIGRDIDINRKYLEGEFKRFVLTREREISHMLGVGYAYSF